MNDNLMIEKTIKVEERILVDKKVISPNWDLITTGTKFKGIIGDCECEGRILIENDTAYLCQNEIGGCEGSTKLGYKHSWLVYFDSQPEDVEITYLELDPEFKYAIPETFTVGNYTCKIYEGFIQVGCTRVENDLVRKIASNLIDKPE